jgi:hypothetical protein
VTSLKEKMEERAGPETLLENSPFEVTDAAVKELMRSPLMRSPTSGYVNRALLFSDDVKSEQIDDILAKFREMSVIKIKTEADAEVDTKSW